MQNNHLFGAGLKGVAHNQNYMHVVIWPPATPSMRITPIIVHNVHSICGDVLTQ